jgi:hypothetical protein
LGIARRCRTGAGQLVISPTPIGTLKLKLNVPDSEVNIPHQVYLSPVAAAQTSALK